jgi:hypothetical protein
MRRGENCKNPVHAFAEVQYERADAPFACGDGLFECADSKYVPHQYAQVEGQRFGLLAFGEFPAAA